MTVIGELFSQDTTIYSQANARLFSNYYTFIKKNKSDKSGTFTQYSGTDDLQYWYGEGVFIETKQKIYLTFDTANNRNRIETVSNTGHSDTLYINWFDWWGEQKEWFSIRFVDTIKNKKTYTADFMTGYIKIPKTDLIDKKLSLVFRGGENTFDFITADNIDEINLFVNDIRIMHTFDKSTVKLKKNRTGFTTTGMWTEEKPTQFVIRNK